MSGTAWLIGSRYALTAGHVVAPDKDPLGLLCGDKRIPFTILKQSQDPDLALLLLDEPCFEHPTVRFASANPGAATGVWPIGCPAGRCGWITSGVVTGYAAVGPEGQTRMLISDAQIFFGNSGGLVTDSEGRAVGLTSGMVCFKGARDVCYSVHVPVETILQWLSELGGVR